MNTKVLFIADIFGRPGRKTVVKLLPELCKNKGPFDLIIANGENAAGGLGITPKIADFFFDRGIDVITTGNHVWGQKEIIGYFDEHPEILRPANLPPSSEVPGKGFLVTQMKDSSKVVIINIAGQLFMDSYDSPFHTITEILEKVKSETNIIIVDCHAEATAEKITMGRYLDGKVSAVLGTHTHVQTADERILPKGTAYITDAGMTGPYDSVIGMDIETIIYRFTTMMPKSFKVAKGDTFFAGVLLEIDANTGKSVSIERIRISVSEETLKGVRSK